MAVPDPVAGAVATLPGGGARVHDVPVHDPPIRAERALMGGRVLVERRAGAVERRSGTRTGSSGGLEPDAVLDRIDAWARRLSRFEPDSELVRLNASAAPRVPIGPTLTAVLDWSREAEARTDGVVDVAMLDARLAAELGMPAVRPLAAGRRWSLHRRARGAVVERSPGVRIDLDGVAKGWLADRALRLAGGDSALVDADGDIALRVAPGEAWAIGVADPSDPDGLLAIVRVDGDGAGGAGRILGLATSGTSVHRWAGAGGPSHHLIDPSTWRPAVTDVVQATVLAGSARLAEAFAKAAVIGGSERVMAIAGRPGVHGVLALTDSGEIRASEGMVRWLA